MLTEYHAIEFAVQTSPNIHSYISPASENLPATWEGRGTRLDPAKSHLSATITRQGQCRLRTTYSGLGLLCGASDFRQSLLERDRAPGKEQSA